MNPHIDAVPLAHAGRTATIRFSWRALQVIQRDWGVDWPERFSEALDKGKVEDLSELIAITTGMSQDEVMDWSPPLMPTVKALWDAYAITRTGQKDASPEGDPENPRNARSILSKASALLHFVQASAGRNSGSKPPTPPAYT